MARGTFYGDLNSSTFSGLLTAGAGADTIVMCAVGVNIDGTNSADITLDFTDSSDSDTAKELLFEASIAGGDNADLMPAPILLKAGDVLRGKASADSDLAVYGWYETYDAT